MEDMVKLDDVELEEVTGGYTDEERKAIIHKIAIRKVAEYFDYYKSSFFHTLEAFNNCFPGFVHNSSGSRSTEIITGSFRYTYGELYDECLIVFQERIAGNQ